MCLGVGNGTTDDELTGLSLGTKGNSMTYTDNNNYIIAGGKFADPFLVTIDKQGNPIDSFRLTNPEAQGATAVIQTDDGGFAVAGKCKGGGFGCTDSIYVLKFDNNNTTCCEENSGGSIGSGGQSTSNPASDTGRGSNRSNVSQTPQVGQYGDVEVNCFVD